MNCTTLNISNECMYWTVLEHMEPNTSFGRRRFGPCGHVFKPFLSSLADRNFDLRLRGDSRTRRLGVERGYNCFANNAIKKPLNIKI